MESRANPSDDTLTSTGLRAMGAGKVLVLGCGALAREILAVVSANGMAPVMAVEVARRGLDSDVRPSADELETMLKGVGK